jgi:copper transport protein
VKKALLLSAVLAALALPGAAWAHAALVRTIPANGAVLTRSPPELRVVFDDVVRPGSGIEAVRNGGGSILAGKAHVEGKKVLVIPLKRGSQKGAYSVRWSIVSDDGHLESGIVAFAVGRGQPAPASVLAPEDQSPTGSEIAWRWLMYAGLLGAVGLALLTLVVRPANRERLALLLSSSAVLAAIGAGAEAHRIGLDTRAGTALGATALAAVVVATLAGAATLAPAVLTAAAAGALVLPLGPAFAGHAYDTGLTRLQVVDDALHLAAAGAWVGALVGIVAFADARGRRTALLAGGGIAVLAVTGVLRAVGELRHVSQLWETSYGRTILVKSGLLLGALAIGWLLRRHLARRAGVELAFAAGIVVAVAVLVLLPPGRSLGTGLVRVSTAEPSPPPVAPPAGSVIVSKEMGELGVALALEPNRTTALVLSPSGGGLDGLDVNLNGKPAESCGQGCYRTETAPGTKVDVVIERFGEPLTATFDVPTAAKPGAALLRRVTNRYRALRSVFFLETLSSSPSQTVNSLWRLEAPDRLEYQIPGGASGIVIGTKRWDRERPDARWEASSQTPLPQPSAGWGTPSNVHLVGSDAATNTLTFVDRATPAYFQLTVDRKTLLPRELRMIAAAHFMIDRYVRFNAPREISPPR